MSRFSRFMREPSPLEQALLNEDSAGVHLSPAAEIRRIEEGTKKAKKLAETVCRLVLKMQKLKDAGDLDAKVALGLVSQAEAEVKKCVLEDAAGLASTSLLGIGWNKAKEDLRVCNARAKKGVGVLAKLRAKYASVAQKEVPESKGTVLMPK